MAGYRIDLEKLLYLQQPSYSVLSECAKGKNGLEAEARALHTAMRRYYSPKSSLEVKHLESVDIAKDTFSLTKPQGDSESIARKTKISGTVRERIYAVRKRFLRASRKSCQLLS